MAITAELCSCTHIINITQAHSQAFLQSRCSSMR